MDIYTVSFFGYIEGEYFFVIEHRIEEIVHNLLREK